MSKNGRVNGERRAWGLSETAESNLGTFITRILEEEIFLGFKHLLDFLTPGTLSIFKEINKNCFADIIYFIPYNNLNRIFPSRMSMAQGLS